MRLLFGLLLGLAVGVAVAASFAVRYPLPDGPIAVATGSGVAAPEAPAAGDQPAPAGGEPGGAPAPEAPSMGAPEAGEDDAAAIGGGDAAPSRPAAAQQVGGGAPDAAPAVEGSSAGVPAVGGADATLSAELVPGEALSQNAAVFEGDRSRPLMAIVLIDDGSEPGLRNTLSTLDAKITFAVVADMPDARAVAAAYRSSGLEVLALPPAQGPLSLAAVTDPAGVGPVLAQVFANVPVAAALMDGIDGPLPRDARIADAALKALQVTGHGLLTHRSTGLNPVPQAADEVGVANDIILRQIDETDQPADIALALERATLDAGRDGSTIVVGRLRQPTVSTLLSWLLGSGARDVTVAPVSALLL